MSKANIIHIILTKATITALVIIMCLSAKAQNTHGILDKYTEERPLVIAADWDFPPYDFRSNNGKANGYNVEVLSLMLDELDVPYVYVMKEWKESLNMFYNGEVDLMLAPTGQTKTEGVHYSRASLGPYRIVIAHKTGDNPPTTIKELVNSNSILYKEGDYAARMIIANGKTLTSSDYCLPRQALSGIINGKYSYYVWGEKPIDWLIKEQNLKDITLTKTNIPAASMRMVSKSKELIDALDDRFVRLDQSGVISKLHNKWLHPEKVGHNEPSILIYFIIAIVVFVLFILIVNRLLSNRLKKKKEELTENSKMQEKALNIGKNLVVTYDLKKKTLSNLYGEFLPKPTMTFDEYLSRIHHDDQPKINKFIESLLNSGNENIAPPYRWNIGTADKPEWRSVIDQSVVEYNHKGVPINIISTFIDVTEDLQKEQEAKMVLEKYSKIIDTALIGLAIYDKNGKLLNTNENMRKIFKFKHKRDEYYYNTGLFDLPFIDDKSNIKNNDIIHLCTRKCLIPLHDISKYLEIRIRKMKDEDGNTKYILITAQDVKEEYLLHKKQKENDIHIRNINAEMSGYQSELSYLLQESKMRVWRSSFDTMDVHFYKDLDCSELSVSFDYMIDNTFGEDNKLMTKRIIGMQKDFFGSNIAILPIKNLAVIDDTVHWYSINSVTDYDSKGNAIGCFGLIRDISELVMAQEQLKEETVRANNSKHQKSVFLANMTHEIRTPLNAIVGFCDLLQTIDSPDDRKEFIRIIRNNCNMLLHLINDILAVSSMDVKGLSIIPREVDFAELFNDTCANLSQQIPNPEAVQFIKENPYTSLIAMLDRNRIEQIITNFTTNAFKHTEQGHVRVGYRVQDEGIYIYCEDTGHGIPKDRCEDVFKRFVKLNDYIQGTGLGLSICKTIADACNGKIGVDSDTGKGATFWFWLPCEIIKK